MLGILSVPRHTISTFNQYNQSMLEVGGNLPTLARYNDLKLQLDVLSVDLSNQEGLKESLAVIQQGLDKVQEYVDNFPQPRLVEADLKQYISDIDSELNDIHALEDSVRQLYEQFPDAQSDPAVSNPHSNPHSK